MFVFSPSRWIYQARLDVSFANERFTDLMSFEEREIVGTLVYESDANGLLPLCPSTTRTIVALELQTMGSLAIIVFLRMKIFLARYLSRAQVYTHLVAQSVIIMFFTDDNIIAAPHYINKTKVSLFCSVLFCSG